ncbi:MAG: DUF4338 domain-containing protein [Candidatus Brocadiaceae bacterium]|nr:DUF4338 domain-containing protein [Candidatus Brocadiaceae bacterium]
MMPMTAVLEHVMGMVLKRIPGDWGDEYGTRPVLVETFVDSDRRR